MKRKPGALLPIELSILRAGIDLLHAGAAEFHGYGIASEIREREAARLLTAHGTLYRALDRLEAAGLLESRLEDAAIAESERRPRRRLYRVTAAGEVAHATAEAPSPAPRPQTRRGTAPT